jgi:hypothetical protein
MDDAKERTDFSYLWWEGEPMSSYITGSSSVRINNGKVFINLGIPTSEYLEGCGDDLIGLIEEGIIVNPSNAKAIIDSYTCPFTNDVKYGLNCVKDYNNEAYLVYADRDVTIKGTTNYGEIWNVSLKKGWNYMIVSFNEATNTETLTASTTLPSGFYWTVFYYG